MKSRVFIAISLLLCMSADVLACGPWYYEPQEYILYRASSNYLSSDYTNPSFSIDPMENCRLWISDTKTGASVQEVYDVVYKASLTDIEELSSKKGKKSRLYKENTFARTLYDDPEALQVLLLAKQCETIRTEMADPWYYPAKVDPHRTALAGVATRSREQLNSKRFWKRYALQATRALLTLGQYQDCLDIWQQVSKKEWNDCLKTLTIRNVAGAYFNLGDVDTARKLYSDIDDSPSLLLCSTGGLKSFILSLYELNPNSKYIRDLVEENIRCKLNFDSPYIDESDKLQIENELYEICLKIAREGKVKDLNFWYYTAAYLEYFTGKSSQALKTATLAEQSAGSDFIKESAHVLRICLEAETKPYSSSYESAMMEHVKWLDNKIVEHLDEAIDATKLYGIDRMSLNESFYYWNDMLRRVVHGTLCPKLIKNHNEVLAIALANMADNRLLNLVDSVTDIIYDEEYNSTYITMSMTEYRANGKLHNDHDYSNAFFNLVDTISVEKVIQYVQTLDKPNVRQQYVKERSYTNRDYLYDLIGTRYLRNAQYSKAKEWLDKVSPEYQAMLNTAEYMDYDPFTFRKDIYRNTTSYKQTFAKEMAHLEQVISTSNNRDSIALAQAKMAIGMKTSVDYCWPLTMYSWYYNDLYDGANTPYSRARDYLLAKVENTYARALSASSNLETKAQIQLMFGNYKSLMASYSNTEAGHSIIGRCDNYYDYHLNKRTTFGEHWIDYERKD